jgi:lipoyl(octanoyl) transferase
MAEAQKSQNLPVQWALSAGFVPYEEAVCAMESRVAAIHGEKTPELVWCLEHPPLYTEGTSADKSELLDPGDLPVFQTGRGGRITWHGPGQRIAYACLDLKQRGSDVRAYVRDLESWIIATLAQFGVTGERREGRIGIWVVNKGGREEKIAALGVRVRRWVSYHGIAINNAPDLKHYEGIVPCGISEFGVTSLAKQGVDISMAELDRALRTCFEETFGRKTTDADPLL